SWHAKPGASQHPERLWRSPPPRGGGNVETKPIRRDAPREKGEGRDEVGDRENEQNKDRRLGRAPRPGEGARQTQEQQPSRGRPGMSGLAALDPTYAWRYGGALFAGLFDIVKMKVAALRRDCRIPGVPRRAWLARAPCALPAASALGRARGQA